MEARPTRTRAFDAGGERETPPRPRRRGPAPRARTATPAPMTRAPGGSRPAVWQHDGRPLPGAATSTAMAARRRPGRGTRAGPAQMAARHRHKSANRRASRDRRDEAPTTTNSESTVAQRREHEVHRPVPEVQPVGDEPDRAQRPERQHRPHHTRRLHRGGRDEHEHPAADANPPGYIERSLASTPTTMAATTTRPTNPRASTHRADRPPGSPRADSTTARSAPSSGPCARSVRAVVGPRWVDGTRRQHRHEDRRDPGEHRAQHAERSAPGTARPRQDERNDQRPHEVPLLFEPERPRVRRGEGAPND